MKLLLNARATAKADRNAKLVELRYIEGALFALGALQAGGGVGSRRRSKRVSENVRRLNHVVGRLRDMNGCAERPLPPKPKVCHEATALPIQSRDLQG